MKISKVDDLIMIQTNGYTGECYLDYSSDVLQQYASFHGRS